MDGDDSKLIASSRGGNNALLVRQWHRSQSTNEFMHHRLHYVGLMSSSFELVHLMHALCGGHQQRGTVVLCQGTLMMVLLF